MGFPAKAPADVGADLISTLRQVLRQTDGSLFLRQCSRMTPEEVSQTSSAGGFDDLEELVKAVALAAGEVDELLRSLDNGATFGCPCNRDATPAPELEQSFVAEQPQRTQHGVAVDAEDGGEVLRRREALSRLCLSLCNRTADLGGDLFVEIGGVGLIHLDTQHDVSHTSATNHGGRQ